MRRENVVHHYFPTESEMQGPYKGLLDTGIILLIKWYLKCLTMICFPLFSYKQPIRSFMLTFISSGKHLSTRFSFNLFKMSSSVASLVGFFSFCTTCISSPFPSSSWSREEPKLFGRVLLRGRVWGMNSPSELLCFASEMRTIAQSKGLKEITLFV